MKRALFLVTLLAACDPAPAPSMVVYVAPEHEALAQAFVAPLPVAGIAVRAVPDPAAALGSQPDAPEIALVADLSCTECYRAERVAGGVVVHGDAPAGIQYGLAHVLEAMGFRFYHPQRTLAPSSLALPDEGDAVFGPTREPEMTVRGLHLHTLHPIEAYWAVWEPGEAHLEEARRIIDWIVKNRGNRVTWAALDDVRRDPARAEAVREHARAIVDYAHMRGVHVGLGVQLFAGANLQHAFDLTTGGAGSAAQIRERLALLDGIGFDELKISFGEFGGEDPALFLATLNDAVAAARERWPDVEIAASIHVGDYPETRISYMGEELLYYFLVRYADPSIVPWIHTVMYYTLYEDAGLAYLHEDFGEHRAYLLDRLRAGERVAYYPESAYWVAFDNSVPTYLPLYIRSRWLDQARLREDAAAGGFAPLSEHVTFTSGWEWGYWQTDYVTLRSHYALGPWEEAVREMLAPQGARGAVVADAIVRLAELQREHLVVGRLAPYLAGRDAVIDIGRTMGIVSQPDRPLFEEVLAMDDAQRAELARAVVSPLGAMADATDAILADVEAAGVDDEPWLAETRDGIAVDAHRARFAHLVWSAVAAEGDARALLEEASRELDAARVVVARRHGAMHDPSPERLTARRVLNATLYQYGYLREAHLLCFWERELAQARNLLLAQTERVPGCVL